MIAIGTDAGRTAAVRASVAAEDWEFEDARTDDLTHDIHRYSGKFIPQIAARAIETVSEPGELVLDMFCGSGTTLLEAARLGRRAIGIDLNPLAVLISACKITPVSAALLARLEDELGQILDCLVEGAGHRDLPALKESAKDDPRASDDWFIKWHGTSCLEELLVIDAAIRRLDDAALRNIATLCLSNILRKASRAHSSYPNLMFDRNAQHASPPSKVCLRELHRVRAQVASLAGMERELAGVRVVQGDAARLPLDDASVDAIVTHPPYIGSVPYAEYGALSLKWLGMDPRELDRRLMGGRRHACDVVARFAAEYESAVAESHRVLKPGKFMFLMVGSPIVKGRRVDLADMTRRFAARAGFCETVAATRRGANRRANRMGAETLLFFQKQAAADRSAPVNRA